jgi:hypothetical protein
MCIGLGQEANDFEVMVSTIVLYSQDKDFPGAILLMRADGFYEFRAPFSQGMSSTYYRIPIGPDNSTGESQWVAIQRLDDGQIGRNTLDFKFDRQGDWDKMYLEYLTIEEIG